MYYPDGTETQRVGIVPDIEVKPTIKGITEGRDELLEGLWRNAEEVPNERTIDVQINRLRRKIEDDPANPVWLQTVRGIGYRLSMD